MLTRLTVVIISQYIHIVNHYIIYLKLVLYVYLSKKFKKYWMPS